VAAARGAFVGKVTGSLLDGLAPTGTHAGMAEAMLGMVGARTRTAGVLPARVRDAIPDQPITGSLPGNRLSCKALRVSSMSDRAPSLALSW
jgi:hypothetical protein